MRLLFLSIFFISTICKAQTDSTIKAIKDTVTNKIKEDTTLKAWEVSLNLGVNLSHTMQVNGKANSGKEGFATTNAIDLNLNYRKNRIISTNEFHWQFSLYREGLNTITQKTSDEFLTLHDFSLGIDKTNVWNVNLIAKSSTGIFSTYKDGYFRDTTGGGKVQSFLNPYEFILSPGVKWQPIKHLRISFSPYTIRFYGLIDQSIANTGLYIDQLQGNGQDYLKNIIEQRGAEMNIWYDRKIKKWLQLQYRIGIKSSYAENILDNGTIDGLFISKIKLIKNIFLTHRATLRGTFEQKPFKPTYIQVITLSYSIVF
jgi:hypothetical protein